MSERYESASNTPRVGSSTRTNYDEPLERFHWPSILGGVFIALSLFVLTAALGTALSLSGPGYDGHASDNKPMIWGIVTAPVAFGIGAFFTGRSARQYNYPGWLNGAMVWAVAVPLTIYALGMIASPAATLAAGHTSANRDQTASRYDNEGAVPAAARFDGTRRDSASASSTLDANSPDRAARDDTRRAAWGTFIALVAGLAAAAAAGYLGAASGDHTHHDIGHSKSNVA